jgi:hypothetical protein
MGQRGPPLLEKEIKAGAFRGGWEMIKPRYPNPRPKKRIHVLM